jgi:hypothetical protein
MMTFSLAGIELAQVSVVPQRACGVSTVVGFYTQSNIMVTVAFARCTLSLEGTPNRIVLGDDGVPERAI